MNPEEKERQRDSEESWACPHPCWASVLMSPHETQVSYYLELLP